MCLEAALLSSARMEFGEVMLAWYEDCSNLFKNILWSDEAIFHIDGLVNRHSCHY